MKPQMIVGGLLITAITILAVLGPSAAASLCHGVTILLNYPHEVSENQRVQVSAMIAGSCVSDGEDYFGVRIDLVDNFTHAVLSSNSTPIGYNANNFSVIVTNGVIAPNLNETWSVGVNTYLIQAGAISGAYILNATSIAIHVGDSPMPELPISTSLVLAAMLLFATVTVSRRGDPKGARKFRIGTGDQK